MNFNDAAIVSIKGNDYRIHFRYMSKNDAIVLMTNSHLKDKNGIFIHFFTIYKRLVKNLLSKKQRSDFKQSKRLL